jgi:nucleotide-binding universal stress UspA family protein
VATDGSDGARRAVDYAAQLAKSCGADLLIVNVMGHGLPVAAFRRFTHAQQAWLEELLASLSADILTEARERVKPLGVTTILESRGGNVVETIGEIAREKSADLIVVGQRGAGRLAEVLLGSVAQKLVSLAPCPVTVVP